jgi:hypothetical protein
VIEQDLLGRTVEERKESLSGKVLYKKRFVYKDFGCTIEEITFPNNTPAIEKIKKAGSAGIKKKNKKQKSMS